MKIRNMVRPTNTDNVIDIRDVIARVEHLEKLRQPGSVDLGNDEDNETDQDTLFTELASLEKLLENCCGNGGDEKWRGNRYPLTLIRDSHFEDYARELAEDIGAIKRDMGWPYSCIDWKAAAEALLQDYTEIDFDGVMYWTR